ncbi:MAG: TraR/DksA family transcriptional regulator [Acidimicrobiia bacterium]
MSEFSAERRASLEQERDRLRAQLATIGHGDDGELDYDQNFADSSQVTAEKGEAEALATKLNETLAEVEHALAKLDEGNYGSCEACGREITEARLEAMPETRYCIECASARR